MEARVPARKDREARGSIHLALLRWLQLHGLSDLGGRRRLGHALSRRISRASIRPASSSPSTVAVEVDPPFPSTTGWQRLHPAPKDAPSGGARLQHLCRHRTQAWRRAPSRSAKAPPPTVPRTASVSRIDAQTWTSFSGKSPAPPSRTRPTRQLVWKYFQGPTAPIFYNIRWASYRGSQLEGIPSASSQSATGATVGGLQPQSRLTTSPVVAKYPDGTSTIQSFEPAHRVHAHGPVHFHLEPDPEARCPPSSTPATPHHTSNAAVFTASRVALGQTRCKPYFYDPSLTPTVECPTAPTGTPTSTNGTAIARRPPSAAAAATSDGRSTYSHIGVSTSAPASRWSADTLERRLRHRIFQAQPAAPASSTGMRGRQKSPSRPFLTSRPRLPSLSPLPIVHTGPGLQIRKLPFVWRPRGAAAQLQDHDVPQPRPPGNPPPPAPTSDRSRATAPSSLSPPPPCLTAKSPSTRSSRAPDRRLTSLPSMCRSRALMPPLIQVRPPSTAEALAGA